MASWIETTSGFVLPNPVMGSSGLTISTMVDGGRNVEGNFVGSVIGLDKLSIDIEFVNLTSEQFKNFLRLFDRSYGGSFVNEFRIFDPRENNWVVKKMYVGDRSGRPIKFNKETVRPAKWTDVKAKLVEV